MKIPKRIDVTDEIAINIPKKAIFSIFNASLLLLLKQWEIVIFFTYFNWLLDGPKILVTTPPPPQPPGLHLGPCLQALIFHWQCCEILTFFWSGGGGIQWDGYQRYMTQDSTTRAKKDLHIEGIYFHKTADNHLSPPSSQEETIVSV